MPRKSTLFTPKPRTGLLIRAYADEPDWSGLIAERQRSVPGRLRDRRHAGGRQAPGTFG